jgi:tetratricopeptide (TPR) repeat protein
LGLASGVVVLTLHAAVDNLSERPALVLTGAALAGAALARGGSRAGASGRGEGTTTRGALATGAVPPLEAGGAAAIARAVVVVAIAAGVHLAFVAGPWMAWRAGQEGLRLASIDPEGARTAIAAAIRWNPFHPSYRSTLAGLAVHPRGASPPGPRELAEGLLNVGEARRLSPEDSRWPLQEARLWRAGFTGMFHERSSLDRALAAYGEAERLSGVDPFIPLERATLHAAVGEREEAFAAMDRAIALEPNFFGARLARARLAAEAGDARSAQQALAEAERRRGLLSGTAPSADQLYERQILAWNEEAAAAIRHLYLP